MVGRYQVQRLSLPPQIDPVTPNGVTTHHLGTTALAPYAATQAIKRAVGRGECPNCATEINAPSHATENMDVGIKGISSKPLNESG